MSVLVLLEFVLAGSGRWEGPVAGMPGLVALGLAVLTFRRRARARNSPENTVMDLRRLK